MDSLEECKKRNWQADFNNNYISNQLTSCSHYNKQTKTMWGFGRYKDAEVEQECYPVKIIK